MADPPTLGSRLGAIREDQGLSLKEAATFTRLTTSYLWYVEQDSVGESFLNFQVVAKREQEQRAELDSVPDVVVTVPYFETDIYDLAGLLRAGRAMWGEDATVS